VGSSPAFIFILVPFSWASNAQLMQGLNDVMSFNMENNTRMLRSVAPALHIHREDTLGKGKTELIPREM